MNDNVYVEDGFFFLLPFFQLGIYFANDALADFFNLLTL